MGHLGHLWDRKQPHLDYLGEIPKLEIFGFKIGTGSCRLGYIG